MREIKFRAWDKSRSKFHNSGNLHIEVSPYGTLCWTFGNQACEPLFGKERDNWVLMQYTGRIASGKELYDGDIFRIHDNNPDYFNKYAFECYWDGIGWNARIVQGPDGGYDSDYTQNWLPPIKEDCYEPEDSTSYIIVGNIYQNPELLKKTN